MVESPSNTPARPTPALDRNHHQQDDSAHSIMENHHQDQGNQTRLCDNCDEAEALLYCRADSAKLCLSCDKEVHATNQLFAKHYRSQLCDICDSSPASVFCETEQRVLCQNCDWETHSSSRSSVHSRRPIEGFTGSPSVAELVAIIGFDDLGNKALFLGGNGVCDEINGNHDGVDDFGVSEFLIWDTPQIVSLNDLVVPTGSEHNFRATEVPPLPKNRNAACGKRKEEMLRQLRQLGKSELSCISWPNFGYGNLDLEADIEFQFLMPPQQDLPQGDRYAHGELDMNVPIQSHEESGLQWLSDSAEPAEQDFLRSSLLSGCVQERYAGADKELSITRGANCAGEGLEGNQHFPVTTGSFSVVPEVNRHEINTQERDSAISRYKEKKKMRRYDKHIRYESRKLRAENRTRIKGRFAKIDR